MCRALGICAILHARLHQFSRPDSSNPGMKSIDGNAYFILTLICLSFLYVTDPSLGMVVPTLRPFLAPYPDGYIRSIARATLP